ncbi:MAG: hypothetical protein KDB53_14790 [Planctomycetes bacterium]|nr:hypothetical protein [Planctomycetota bacterium]
MKQLVTQPPHVYDYARLGAEELDDIKRQVQLHFRLDTVLRWCASSVPTRAPQASVAQDEFSHDVVVPFADGLYLAYDVT